MNIRYPIYEGVYRILTIKAAQHRNSQQHTATDKVLYPGTAVSGKAKQEQGQFINGKLHGTRSDDKGSVVGGLHRLHGDYR